MDEQNKKPADVDRMDLGEAKQEDTHLTKGFTGWVHHHRTLARWLMKALVAIIASLLYYLRKEERHIEEEEKKK